MKKFRVPQREVVATVTLYGGQQRRGRLFVPPSGPRGGPGRLTDRLNDDSERFLALSDEGSGCLVSKDRIVHVDLDSEQGALELEPQVAAHEIRVRVEVAGGSPIEGVLPYTMPPDKERLIDYLNAAPRFIPLLGGEGLVLLNRDYVTAVTGMEHRASETG